MCLCFLCEAHIQTSKAIEMMARLIGLEYTNLPFLSYQMTIRVCLLRIFPSITLAVFKVNELFQLKPQIFSLWTARE